MTTPSTVARQARLPPLLLLTDRSQLPTSRRLTDVVAACVGAGLRAVVVRERDLEDRERADLVHDLEAVLAPVGGLLLVGAPELGRPDGVHLRRADAPPRARPWLLGRSCHDAGDLHRAARERCDYVTLSPVAESPSKPGYGPPLGAAGLTALARRTPALASPSREAPNFPVTGPGNLARHAGGGRSRVTGPGNLARHAGGGGSREAGALPAVYALGGVTPGNAAQWLDAGAEGVAVMGAVMRADDPAAVVADLLRAVDRDPRVTPDPVRRGGAGTRPETTRPAPRVSPHDPCVGGRTTRDGNAAAHDNRGGA
ncbi:MAG: thiamine phosphate synthase [Actinomycetota bacterium]|nr:thiamine phosphate synthase [Actinomycetota bacterium]MDQ4084274.1 thiamine phosphate synthase [Actinomycetota bacterium]